MAAEMETSPWGQDLSPHDVVIAVMGITGSGKSTFISLLADQDVTIGHDLESCTSNVGVYSYIHKNTRRVYLIDTPGFDDTRRTDTEVLKDVAFFLTQTYKQTIHLAGIIYLHRITDVRMPGSSLRNLSMFKKLCGDDAYKHVVLATTMWGNLAGSNVSFDTGVGRERELLQRKDWWGHMYERGSKIARHTGDKDCAFQIISSIVDMNASTVLDIQKEMVDQQKHLEDTAAGREVEKELQEAKQQYRDHIKDLKEGYKQALKDRDDGLAEALLQQQKEYEEKLEKATKGQEDLKISLQQLSEEKNKEYQDLLQRFQDQQQHFTNLLAQNQEELDRVEKERLEQVERSRRTQEEQEQRLRRYREDMTNLENKNKADGVQRDKDESKRLAQIEAGLKKQMVDAQKENERRVKAFNDQVQVMKAEQARLQVEKSSASKWLMPVLGVFTVFAGVATMNPGLAHMGTMMSMAGAGGAGS